MFSALLASIASMIKRELKIVAALLCLISVGSCSKGERFFDRSEFDANIAESYYLGTDSEEKSVFNLKLASGRVDEDFQLSSLGALMSVHLRMEGCSGGAIPAGRYEVDVDPSFVELRTIQNNSESMMYSIEKGSIFVSLEPDYDYEIEARLVSNGRVFEFEYEGKMTTYNYSSIGLR